MNRKKIINIGYILSRPLLAAAFISTGLLLSSGIAHAASTPLKTINQYQDEHVVIDQMQEISLIKLGKFNHYEIPVIQKELDLTREEQRDFCFLYRSQEDALIPYRTEMCYQYGYGYVSKSVTKERFPDDKAMEDALSRLKSSLLSAGYIKTDSRWRSWFNFDDKKFLHYSNTENKIKVSYNKFRKGTDKNGYKDIEPAIKIEVINKEAADYLDNLSSGVRKNFNDPIYQKVIEQK